VKKYQLLIAVLITAPIAMLFVLSDSVTGGDIQAKKGPSPLVFSAPVLQAGYGEERACPLDAQSGRIVVEFVASPQDIVLTTRSQSRISFGPLPVNIPAGTYDITLVSFDDHVESPEEVAQKEESWFLQAYNAQGDAVFESNPISDLPEAQNTLEELVQTGGQITQDIPGVSARHLLDVGASETAEGITPVCAAFDRVDADHEPERFSVPKTALLP
jgi:hypothetical protein